MELNFAGRGGETEDTKEDNQENAEMTDGERMWREKFDESERLNKELEKQVSDMAKQLELVRGEQKKAELLEQAVRERLSVVEAMNSSIEKVSEEEKVIEKEKEEVKEEEEEDKGRDGELAKQYEAELLEKEKELTSTKSKLLLLKEKELACNRYEEEVKELKKEIESLHLQLQKKESAFHEEKIKLENRTSFAEQSLEAYKKEIESSISEKLNLEAENKEMKNKLDSLQKAYDVILSMK